MPEVERAAAADRADAFSLFVPFPPEDTECAIGDRFAKQVAIHGGRSAACDPSGVVTYHELDERVGRLTGHVLHVLGGHSVPVATLLDPGIPAVVAILGLLKANKFYVPLDPRAPVERLRYVLADCTARTILCTADHAALAREIGAEDAAILVLPECDASSPPDVLPVSVGPDSLAYLLYTSGSTGRPKGVVQNHRNVLHSILRHTNVSQLHCEDRIALTTNLSFSAAVGNMFSALLNGATLCIPSPLENDPRNLPDWLNAQGITVYSAVVSAFRALVGALPPGASFPSVRLFYIGGEQVHAHDLEAFTRHFSPSCQFQTSLGFTEINMVAKRFVDRYTRFPGGILPAGYPTEGITFQILGDDDQLLPPGEVGEIIVRSRYLSAGYWRRPDLTESAFLPDPTGAGERGYRTGDLGSLAADGCLAHLGRKDLQVKIRGHRVELGEVEAALLDLPGVQGACAVANRDRGGHTFLVAYVAIPPSGRNVSETRSRLGSRLPAYMVPSLFVFLDTLPVTTNGKVDRRALPPPDRSRPVLSSPWVSPRDDLERRLVKIWERALKVQPVGVQDNFFDLGGDSLRAVEVFSQIERQFQRRLPLTELLRAGTIEDLAAILKYEASPGRQGAIQPLQPSGTRPPLFFCHGVGASVLHLRALALSLDPDQPVYGIAPTALDGAGTASSDLRAMVSRYVQELRAFQNEGPYYLAGYSSGGIVALEVAHELLAHGQPVGLLLMIDTFFPGRLSLRPPWVRAALHLQNMARSRGSARLDYLRARACGIGERLRRLPQWVGRLAGPSPRDGQASLVVVEEANRRAILEGFRPRLYPGRIVYLRSADAWTRFTRRDPREGWGALAAGGLEVYELAGDHSSIMTVKGGGLYRLAGLLGQCLSRAQAGVCLPSVPPAGPLAGDRGEPGGGSAS